MPKKYFCEYCGIYLTHSSPGGRKQHALGRKHINNKIEYYSQFLYEVQQNNYNNLLNIASKNAPNSQSNQIIQITPSANNSFHGLHLPNHFNARPIQPI
jgi:hypothetical protein